MTIAYHLTNEIYKLSISIITKCNGIFLEALIEQNVFIKLKKDVRRTGNYRVKYTEDNIRI